MYFYLGYYFSKSEEARSMTQEYVTSKVPHDWTWSTFQGDLKFQNNFAPCLHVCFAGVD